jgi:uncharacterized membrane protein
LTDMGAQTLQNTVLGRSALAGQSLTRAFAAIYCFVSLRYLRWHLTQAMQIGKLKARPYQEVGSVARIRDLASVQ